MARGTSELENGKGNAISSSDVVIRSKNRALFVIDGR